MLDIDSFLEKKGLSYDALTPTEKETYHHMVESLSAGQLTLEKLRDSLYSMKLAVEEALVDTPEFIFLVIPNRKHVYLKARLKNYILLDALLSSPERMEKNVERQLEAMGGR